MWPTLSGYTPHVTFMAGNTLVPYRLWSVLDRLVEIAGVDASACDE